MTLLGFLIKIAQEGNDIARDANVIARQFNAIASVANNIAIRSIEFQEEIARKDRELQIKLVAEDARLQKEISQTQINNRAKYCFS